MEEKPKEAFIPTNLACSIANLPGPLNVKINSRISTYILVLGGLFLIGFWYPLVSLYEIDDAYVTYQYATNLANGHGLVFNPGAAKVEGATSLLWTLLLTSMANSGFLPGFARLLTAVFGLLITCLTVQLSQKLRLKDKLQEDHLRVIDIVPAVIINLFPSLPYWSGSGMEIDLLLNREGGFLTKVYPPEYILNQKPSYFFLRPGAPIDNLFLDFPEFKRDYEVVGTIQLNKIFDKKYSPKYLS